jgi:hypothetical protein
MTTMYYYTLTYIDNISCNLKTKNVSEETLSLITSLTEQVTSPSYNKTPIFINNNNNKRKHKHNNTINNEDWEATRNFQKTEFVKPDGIQKNIDSIRILINKITEKTYDPIIIKLMEKLDSFDETITESEDINKIGTVILDMATTNRFNSKIYAKLCKQLSSKYEFMKIIIDNSIKDFMKLFDKVETVDPNENYDEFCKLNIINDNRRAMSLFLCNLYDNDFIDFTIISSVLTEFTNRVYKNKLELASKLENDEISESIFIIVSNCPLKKIKSIANFEQYINEITQLITSENNGISNKTKFKHMDIKSLLNK